MANFDSTNGVNGVAFSGNAINKVIPLKNTITFSDHSGLAATDTITVLRIPAGTYVSQMILRTVTASALAATCSIGDASSAAGWIAVSTPLNSAAETTVHTTAGDAYATSIGKCYAVDTIITMQLAAQIPDGVVEITALCCVYGG